MAALNSYKTKNQIFSDFIELTQSALTAFDITGWKIKRLFQAVKSVDTTPFIFLQVVNKHQAGAQYTSLAKVEKNNKTDYYKLYNTKQEIQIRFSATMRNKVTETVDTLDCIDVLEIVKNWLQSDAGILALTQKGYAQYRATDIKQQNFENDDENVQFLPYFDCTYLYTDVWKNTINNIDSVELQGIYKT